MAALAGSCAPTTREVAVALNGRRRTGPLRGGRPSTAGRRPAHAGCHRPVALGSCRGRESAGRRVGPGGVASANGPDRLYHGQPIGELRPERTERRGVNVELARDLVQGRALGGRD